MFFFHNHKRDVTLLSQHKIPVLTFSPLDMASVTLQPLVWVQQGDGGGGSLRWPRITDAAAAAADDETDEVVARFSCRHQNTEKTRHCLLHSKHQITTITANASSITLRFKDPRYIYRQHDVMVEPAGMRCVWALQCKHNAEE